MTKTRKSKCLGFVGIDYNGFPNQLDRFYIGLRNNFLVFNPHHVGVVAEVVLATEETAEFLIDRPEFALEGVVYEFGGGEVEQISHGRL